MHINDIRNEPLRLAMATQIEELSIPEPNTGCWLWLGHGDRYGGISFPGNNRLGAHRVSYVAFIGEIPNGLFVLHKCDVPFCVNPGHLFLGTQADNLADMRAKGRSVPRGKTVNFGKYYGKNIHQGQHRKLTFEQATTIRNTNATNEELGKVFGVHPKTIRNIRLWKLYRKP